MLIEMTLSEATAARDALARSYNNKRKRKVRATKMGALSTRAIELGNMHRAIDVLDAAINRHQAEIAAELERGGR